jgi:putative Holliday junction resolvase
MTVLALDVGDRRIGVAVSDPTGLVARPLCVITRKTHAADVAAIRQLADQNDADLIVVGVPLSSDDTIGPQAEKTLAFVRYLRKHLSLPVETWDERFTTKEAQREMIGMGLRRRRRKELLDAAAAAVILDEWLTAHRTRPPSPQM